MSLAEDDEVIDTLVIDGVHKALRVRIAIWALRRDLHALHASRLENRDERIREQWISLMDQVLRATKEPVDWIRQIPSHLFHPRFAWVDGNPSDLDGPALDFDDEEDHVADCSRDPQGFHAENVTRIERVPVALHEPLPRALHFAPRCRLDPFLQQDVGHRGPADLDLQPGAKGVADFRVAPAEIGQSHVDHKFPNVFLLPRSTHLAFRAVVIPRRHLPKPPQDRSRLHDLATLPPLVRAQGPAHHGQATALIRGEMDPPVASDRREDLTSGPGLLPACSPACAAFSR